MENIFIGWSGNKNLADDLAQKINNSSSKKAIVGGGEPKDMFIGAQVLAQIDRSDFAVLLVENKEDGRVSSNLMFEWGYITAKMSINNICTVLINISPRDLPSDLLGTWVFEISYDREKDEEVEIVNKIYEIVQRNLGEAPEKNYFNLVDRWNQVFMRLKTNRPNNDDELVEHILMGCLAAYYYMDNVPLKKFLNTLSVNVTANEAITFAKAYIDVFLESANMTNPLSQDQVFLLMQVFESTIARKRGLSKEIDLLLDILCYDAYGLSCSLYLKNKDIDPPTLEFFSAKALECYGKALELFEGFMKDNGSDCLNILLKSYLYNDLAHLYRDVFNDHDKFREYLNMSVDNRKQLHQTFTSLYPGNVFLATKFEQEYIIALSEQCNYMEESFMKTMYKKTVISKFVEWQKELVYTSSLTDRIAANIKNYMPEGKA